MKSRKSSSECIWPCRAMGEGCERMPNQLKPKKLDLPHLHPCSHRLQITLQGRIGKARHAAARGMQPNSRQGRVALCQ